MTSDDGGAADDRPESPSEAEKLRFTQVLAMPVTRMLDYGMDPWDANQLSNSDSGTPWDTAASELARTQVVRAQDAVQQGSIITAAACLRRATAAFNFAQMAFNSDTDRKRNLYQSLVDSYSAAAELDTHRVLVERLQIPHRDSHCVGWLVRPAADRVADGVVVIVGGQSGWGSAYHRQAEALADRGLATLLLEAPGQGETRIFNGLYLDRSVDSAFQAALDVLADRDDLTPRFGVWGNSFGGLLAARAAVADCRFTACCVNGAEIDPRPSQFRTAREQAMALTGTYDDEELARTLESVWLDPMTDSMDASLLVLHGAADPLQTLDAATAFMTLSEDANIRVWEDGEHTIYNHSAERTEFVADWFRRKM
ncbi:alpha/beta fold hydrolase [Gordonia sp. TBRC 11910]|uniref:Alpha/beta fold hydrolase n=1 Tax=Gordonia asplenii TaxID=2725283 RepID=A0A848L0M6_9ACTN|nr:alpha/beta fold hydrolase [Gordonia asplenii]NMO04510.1 alpha/beta fold hydrolase [Gordonia asplenii]